MIRFFVPTASGFIGLFDFRDFYLVKCFRIENAKWFLNTVKRVQIPNIPILFTSGNFEMTSLVEQEPQTLKH